MIHTRHLNKQLSKTKKRNGQSSILSTTIKLPWQQHVRHKELVDFTRQLATMIEAKLPLANCLSILERQQKRNYLKQVIHDILRQIQAGKSLSEGLSLYPKVFSELYINMIRVGELSGQMISVLNQLSQYLEKVASLRRKIITAFTYPAVIILVAIGSVSFLVFGVMPSFKEMFQDFGTDLPVGARVLMSISQFIQDNVVYLVLILIGIFWGLKKILGTEKGGLFFDKLKFKLPIFGQIVKKTILARFTSTLGTLLRSGVPLLQALDVTSNSVSNRLVKRHIQHMRLMASKGQPMEQSAAVAQFFPDLVIQMIAVGEETAELPDMLIRTGEYYENEVDASIEMLTSIIEPVIIVSLGVILGSVVVIIYTQIFELMNVIE